jgi:hypothetical protein
MAPRKSHHVVPNSDGGWDTKKGGSPKVIKHFDHKEEAIEYMRKISQNQNSELIIHGRDGKIQQSDSHGNDPNPPKDKD